MGKAELSVLFLCTGNSARSILAEAILNYIGKGRFKAFSAGSHPAGKVNPFALELLQKHSLPVTGLHSKSWDEFAKPGAPQIDFVFTVCDNAAGEACPRWPGRPAAAHWGIADPAAVQGSDAVKQKAFEQAYRQLQSRIAQFVALPVEKMDSAVLKRELSQIGRTTDRAQD